MQQGLAYWSYLMEVKVNKTYDEFMNQTIDTNQDGFLFYFIN